MHYYNGLCLIYTKQIYWSNSQRGVVTIVYVRSELSSVNFLGLISERTSEM